MIHKASQRAGGQNLAIHLLNGSDNEYVEVAEVRGAVATNLHGAFAEWEAIAHNLTPAAGITSTASRSIPIWVRGKSAVISISTTPTVSSRRSA